jgi:glycosyltransferase involved in cell wall biosynthesis
MADLHVVRARNSGSFETAVRILHVTHAGVLSGAEIALARLVEHLGPLGAHSIVACGADDTLAAELRRAGVTVDVVELPASLAHRRRAQLKGVGVASTIPDTLRYAGRIYRAARRHRVDVIHTNSMKAHVAGLLAAKAARIPAIAHIHDDLGNLQTGSGVSGLVRTMLQRFPQRVVGCSAYVLDAAGVGADRSAVVYSGIPADLIRDDVPARPGPPVVGMVARIAEWKGQHLFLEAAEIVASRRPDVRFRVVGAALFGEDAYLERVRRLAAIPGLAGRVEFTGRVDDTVPHYDDFTVAVACSIEPEPFGQVVVEAMARGCAVIAPAEGGPLEVVNHEADGFLVPVRDAGALAAAILRLLGDDEERRTIAKAALETARHYTLENTARRFCAVAQEVTT